MTEVSFWKGWLESCHERSTTGNESTKYLANIFFKKFFPCVLQRVQNCNWKKKSEGYLRRKSSNSLRRPKLCMVQIMILTSFASGPKTHSSTRLYCSGERNNECFECMVQRPIFGRLATEEHGQRGINRTSVWRWLSWVFSVVVTAKDAESLRPPGEKLALQRRPEAQGTLPNATAPQWDNNSSSQLPAQ